MGFLPHEIINDRFQIESPLGEGASGKTYRALDMKTGRQVVVKILRIEKMDDFKSLDLFKRETAVLKTINHPNIPDYIDNFETTQGNQPCFALVQEYAAGENLYQRVKNGARFSTDQVVRIISELLKILKYIHTLHPPVIHRDINPKNIILDKDNKVYLVDFGAVGSIRRDTLSAARSDTFVGTIGYMPPEQLYGKVLPSSDLYSLGITAVFLLTGREPHELDFRKLKLNYHQHVDIPEHLRVFLDMLINPAIEERIESAAAALHVLDDPSFKNRQPPRRRRRETVSYEAGQKLHLGPPPRKISFLTRIKLYAQEKGGSFKVGLIFVASGMLFAFFFVFMGRIIPSVMLSFARSQTYGTVINVEETNSIEDDVTVYKNTFEFNPTDTTSLVQYSFTTGRKHNQGDQVLVNYMQSNPKFSVIENARYSVFSPFVLFVLIFPIVGYVMLFRGRPRRMFQYIFLLKHGS